MTFKLARAARETVTTTGAIDVTDTLDLGGPTDDHLQTFVVAVGDTNQTIVRVISGDNAAWLEAVVTVGDSTPDTLTIDDILASSSAGAGITLSAGTRVFGIIPTDWDDLFDRLFGGGDGGLLYRWGGVWTARPADGVDDDILTLVSGQPVWLPPAEPSLTLGDLTDVNLTGLADSFSLRWDSTPGEWVVSDVGLFRSVLAESENAASGTSIGADNYVSTQDPETSFPIMALRQYGGTKASPSAILVDTVLGHYTFYGYDGTSINFGAGVQAVATENWTGSTRGTKLLFAVIANGTTIPVFPLELDQDGTLLLDGDAVLTIKSVPYGIAFSSPQTVPYTTSQVIGHHKVGVACTIPANFAAVVGQESGAGGTANATGSTVFSVEQALAASPNTFSQIGTITFGAGGVSATLATVSGTSKSLAQGDVLRVVAPAIPDTTFAGFYATINAQR